MSTSTTSDAGSQAAPFEKFEFASFASTPVTEREVVASKSVSRLRIEIGRTNLSVEDQHKLAYGEVIALDEATDAPVRIYIDDRLAALGELVVIEQKFCVRVTEVVS